MLERIERIHGVGLLHSINGKPFKLDKNQLIYAENGRGKSTLASVLRSVSSGDPKSIIERKTIDGTTPQLVDLLFENGQKVNFSGANWSTSRPEMVVFDADFVEANVHSGGTVTPNQRKSLLSFALGTKAVKAQADENQASSAATAANARVTQITQQLSGHHAGLALTHFTKLPQDLDAENKIGELQKKVEIANNINLVLTRPIPAAIQLPSFDIEALFTILNRSLADIEGDAEAIVSTHFGKCTASGFEAWISDGQKYDNGQDCPYCGQSTADIKLISAYKTHFNKAYSELKQQVAVLERGIAARTSEAIIDQFAKNTANAEAQIAQWRQEVSIPAIRLLEGEAKSLLIKLREHLSKLVEHKLNRPLDVVGTQAEKQLALQYWDSISTLLTATNEDIASSAALIAQYKAGLAQENSAALNAQINLLRAGMARHTPAVVTLLSDLNLARTAATDAERQKKAAREKLNVEMEKILGSFQTSINKILEKFGASFRIEKMDSNFRGGAARSDYGLSLRGVSISLSGPPKFSTALSEGDKRTLAFAFFLATINADTDISKKIVVIDDPMCSLDANRKHQTRQYLKQLAEKAKQLIVLAHDPFFIRELKLELENGNAPLSILQLKYAQDGYSAIDAMNIDKECESPYYRHHRMLVEMISGTGGDQRATAKAIRPYLEGYLHRRFPGEIPKGLMFGQAIGHLKQCPKLFPFISGIIEELQEINTYAGQFHHDTNPGHCETIPVVTAELIGFCTRALDAAYRGNA